MMPGSYAPLREEMDQIPVIETHVHYTSNTAICDDVFPLILGYLKSDLRIAAGAGNGALIRYLMDASISLRDRYARFAPYYEKCRFSAYAKAMLRGLDKCWGIKDVSYASLCMLQERLPERDDQMLQRILRQENVRAQVADIFESRFFSIMNGEDQNYWEGSYFAFPLPVFHRLYDGMALRDLEPLIGERPSTLTEYVSRVDALLERACHWGAVCIKDQSAYSRGLDYSHPTLAQAEEAYHQLVAFPWKHLGEGQGKNLDDWLFQHFLDTAARLDLPVQIHTGLQDRVAMYEDRTAGDCRQVDAALLISTMERHAKTRFDLFHASWPNLDSVLFIGKNFPNAWIDLCWAQAIDPIYTIELMRRAVLSLPGSKIFAFGSDAFTMESGIGYLELAKDNMARALAFLVDSHWLSRQEAVEIATWWLYENPLNFFHLNERRKNKL